MRVLSITVVCALLVFVGCTAEQGGDAVAKANQQAVDLFEKIGTTLKGVKDGASAKAASPELSSLTEKLGPIMEQVKALAGKAAKSVGGEKGAGDLGALGKDLAGKAASMLGGPLKDVMNKVTEQIARITKNPALHEPLKGVLAKLQSLMKA